MQNISSFHQFTLKIQSISESSDQNWLHPFLTTSRQKYFDHLLIYVNLNQHAKTQAISLICSGDIID